MDAGYTPGVMVRVVKDVRRFARDVKVDPAGVTRDHVTGWADNLVVSEPARYGYRRSLRTFFRWAFRAGLLTSDPTEGTSNRLTRRKVPQSWEAATEGYLRQLRASGASPATVKLRRSQLTQIAHGVGKSPWDVDVEDLLDWLDTHRDWSNQTRSGYRSTLRSLYGWAVIVGHTDRNPALALPRIRRRDYAPRPAPEAAIEWALQGIVDPRVRLMIVVSASLGLRRDEVSRLHSRDVQKGVDGQWWLMVHGKGDKDRRVPLPENLADELRTRNGWVFPGGDRGHLGAQWVGKLVGQALPEGVTMHQLRHRFATTAYATGRDLLAVQQLLGHVSPTTTQRYVQVPGDSLRRVVEAIAPPA